MSEADPKAMAKDIRSIRQILDQMARQDSSTKTAFDTLYKELEQYKSEFVLSMEKSLLLDLLSFFDSLAWYENTLKENPENASENLQYLMDEYLEVLRRRDVHAFTAKERFDRKYHRVIQVNDAAEIEDDGKIESVLRRGFSRGERTLRDEEVVILRYNKPIETEPKSDPEEEEENWDENDSLTEMDTDGDVSKDAVIATNGIQVQAVSMVNDEDNSTNSDLSVEESEEASHNDD